MGPTHSAGAFHRQTDEGSQTYEDVFWGHVQKAPSGCWEWTGVLKPEGYGRFHFQGRSIDAHRAAWVLVHGIIRRGAMVLHRCDNRRCCNPAHLFLGDAGMNARDMVEKGRHPSQLRVRARVYELTEDVTASAS